MLPRPHSAQVNSGRKNLLQQDLRPARRRSLLLCEVGKVAPKPDVREGGQTRPGPSSGLDTVEDLNVTVKNGLAGYR